MEPKTDTFSDDIMDLLGMIVKLLMNIICNNFTKYGSVDMRRV